jgi:hypothetical protein
VGPTGVRAPRAVRAALCTLQSTAEERHAAAARSRRTSLRTLPANAYRRLRPRLSAPATPAGLTISLSCAKFGSELCSPNYFVC